MNLYILQHTLPDGKQDKYPFFSDHGNLAGLYYKEVKLDRDAEKVVKQLRINYNPKAGESIEISWMYDSEHREMVPAIYFPSVKKG